jgi:hypothetical protein
MKYSSKLNRKLRFSMILPFAFLLLFGKSNAQNRAADSIFTTAKDTLLVKISAVTIEEIKFRRIIGDTAELHSIDKAKVLKIAYGNGETERFDQPVNNPVTEANPRYQLVTSSVFQQEISGWPTERLQVEKREYRAKANSRIATGVVTVVGGSILFAYGLLATVFGESAGGIAGIAGGLAIGAGLTIPLHISGSKNRKKYKLIREELIRRGVEQY